MSIRGLEDMLRLMGPEVLGANELRQVVLPACHKHWNVTNEQMAAAVAKAGGDPDALRSTQDIGDQMRTSRRMQPGPPVGIASPIGVSPRRRLTNT